MNNKEYIAELSRRTGYSQDTAANLVRTLVDAMAGTLEEGETLVWPRFGTFEVKKRLERISVNPATGKRMLVPPKLVLSFKPIASIKEKLKKTNADETNN